jgi:hypothetical protein
MDGAGAIEVSRIVNDCPGGQTALPVSPVSSLWFMEHGVHKYS